MPNTRAKRTGTLWIISALAVGLVAGCGKESGGGGSGGSSNVDRTGGSGGSRPGAGGSGRRQFQRRGSSGASAGGTGGIDRRLGRHRRGPAAAARGRAADRRATPDPAELQPTGGQGRGQVLQRPDGENMMILEFGLEIGHAAGAAGCQERRMLSRRESALHGDPGGSGDPEDRGHVRPVLAGMADTTIMGGTQMLFFTDIDPMTMQPFLGGQRLRPEVNCALHRR